MEIIFDHNLNSGLEAACLILELVAILRSLDTCECKMESMCFYIIFGLKISLKLSFRGSVSCGC